MFKELMAALIAKGTGGTINLNMSRRRPCWPGGEIPKHEPRDIIRWRFLSCGYFKRTEERAVQVRCTVCRTQDSDKDVPIGWAVFEVGGGEVVLCPGCTDRAAGLQDHSPEAITPESLREMFRRAVTDQRLKAGN
jgi:hypothetical protein